MKRGQSVVHILPKRSDRMIPHMDDFPPDVQEVVYEIIAKALIRHAKELEEREEAS
jgi:hypothetical protein